MNDRLDSVAGNLSDREAIDWAELMADASGEERRWIDNLRVISEVSRLARQGHGEPDPGTARPDASGGEWGPLKLLEKIGEGGFGEVYRAWDPGLQRQVALKLVRDDRVAGGWDEQAITEARLLAKVEHPGVAHVYGVQTTEGRTGMWMEFVEGVDLSSLLAERGRLDPSEVARIGVDLCDALSAIHEANVVHKDIKPSNVMRTADGRVVITDFGAGRRRRVRTGESERTLVGTPLAMAPELFAGEPATPQSDVYALGVLLYQLLAGVAPVEGTVQEIVSAHEARRQRPLRAAREDVPPALAALVERALAHDRHARFASAAELQEALTRWIDQGETPVRARRRPRWPVLLAAAGIAAVAVGLWSFWPSGFEAEATFERIRDGQRHALAARDEISPMDQLMISLQTRREAYVYVLNLDRTGRGTLMFPMQGGGLQNPLPAGRHDLPGEVAGEPFAWTFDAVAGLERFLVVASPERMEEFEAELRRLASIDVGEGVRYAVLGDESMQVLLRGISGAAPVARAVPAGDGLLEMARRQAADRESGAWLFEMELFNSGR